MRRLIIGAAVVGVILTLATATGVSAYWQAQQRIDLSATSSGDLDIGAAWRDGPPSWSALLPGASTQDAVIRVTSVSSGATLKWKLLVEHSVPTDMQESLTLTAWKGACGTGTLIPAAGILGPGASASFDVCVRFTLSAGAPASLQGRSVTANITMIAEQVT